MTKDELISQMDSIPDNAEIQVEVVTDGTTRWFDIIGVERPNISSMGKIKGSFDHFLVFTDPVPSVCVTESGQ